MPLDALSAVNYDGRASWDAPNAINYEAWAFLDVPNMEADEPRKPTTHRIKHLLGFFNIAYL